MKSLMSWKFDQIPSWTAELAALDRVTKSFTYLRTIQNILMTCWLSGERSLPFGLLVWYQSFGDVSPYVCSYYFQFCLGC